MGWVGECVTPVLVSSLKLSTHVSTANNWIEVQTGVYGFDFDHNKFKPPLIDTTICRGGGITASPLGNMIAREIRK